MNTQDLITEGYRAYPLDDTLGRINLDFYRERLRNRWGLDSLVDETNNILYVKNLFR